MIGALLATGCGSSGGAGDDAQPETPWPMTGLPGYSQAAASQAITVKIENTEAGRPQLGLGSADIVIQELVEGGLTRLAVIFHSDYPESAGPVRSVRETDIGLVLPTGGTLAGSGGAGSTLAQIEAAGVPLAVEGDVGFVRDPDRRPPYNVLLNVADLSDALPPAPPQQPYFTFGEVPTDARATPAAALQLQWPAASATFTYDSVASAWLRSDPPDAGGFNATNVIALSMPVTFAATTDAAGTPVPIMQTTGSGSGTIATAGQVYEISWSKASFSDPWQFTYQATGGTAQPFAVPAGRTWLALLPQQGGSVTSTPPPSE